MSTEEFINIIKKITTVPTSFFEGKLINAIKFADNGVHSTFFNGETAQQYLTYEKEQADASLKELAVKYISFCISTQTEMGFNTCVSANYDTFQAWISSNTNAIGQRMFMDYMMQPSMLADYFKNPSQWASALAGQIGNEIFLNGLLVECDTIGSMLPPKILLLMMRELDNPGGLNDDGPNFNKVLKSWVTNVRWRNIEGYDRYGWLDTASLMFRQGASAFNEINTRVTQLCVAQDPPQDIEIHGYRGTSTYTHYHIVTSGSVPLAWLDNDPTGPKMYQLRTGNSPNNVSKTIVKDDTGCMVAGTQILMADGTLKQIQDIQEGDKIISGGSIVSVCSSEMVMNDELKHLYSFNDDEPFMSLEHAVMTQRGWCSLAPRLSMALTPHHSVGTLTQGDVVWQVDDYTNGKITYRKVVIQKINVKTFAEGNEPVCFDLHIRDGHPSYHCNGYCCLISYPQITAQRIAANALSDLSHTEQIKFIKQLDDFTPLLEKVMGSPVVTAVKKALQNPRLVAANANHTDDAGIKLPLTRGAANLLVPGMAITANETSTALPADLASISLVNGHLIISGNVANTHCKDNFLYWNRKLDNGAHENGALRLLPHGLLGDGVVSYGKDKIPFTAASFNNYQVVFETSNKEWYGLALGFSKNQNGNYSVTGSISDPVNPKNDALLRKYSSISFSDTVNKESIHIAHVTIVFDIVYCALGFGKWVAAELDFSNDYSFFTGVVYAYEPKAAGYRGAKYNIQGKIKSPTSKSTLLAKVSAKMFAEPVRTSLLDISAQHAGFPSDMLPSMALESFIPLTTDDLFAIVQPDMDLFHSTCFKKMKGIMLLALAGKNETWESWFGEIPPAVGPGNLLSPAEADLVRDDDINDFLVNKFSIGYLTQAFSKSEESNIKAKFAAIPDTIHKLAYFWQGDGNTSFVKSKGYGLASTKLMDFTYADAAPRLKQYLQDDATGWAQKLYDRCTETATLNELALGRNTPQIQQRINHLCMMLHVLDPVERIDTGNGKKISYSTSLYQRIMDVRLGEVIKFANMTDRTELSSFLTEYYRQYFTELLKGDAWEDSIRAKAQQELRQLMAQMEADNINNLVVNLGGVISDSISLLMELGEVGPVATRLRNWSEQIRALAANRYPTLAPYIPGIIGQVLTLGVYGFGIFQCIKAYLGWDKLDDSQRAIAVLNIFNITAAVVKDAASWAALIKVNQAGGDMEEIMEAFETIRARLNITGAGVLDPQMDNLAIQLRQIPDAVANPAMAAAAQAQIEAENAARWVKVSAITEIVAKVVSIGALVGICVGGGFQVANDFSTGQPVAVSVMDIIGEIANAVAAAMEIISTIGTVTIGVASAIPVIGIVAAAVGIIAALISNFIPHKVEETEQEKFIDEHCIPFIRSLDMPTQEWLNKQKNVDHLKRNVWQALAFA